MTIHDDPKNSGSSSPAAPEHGSNSQSNSQSGSESSNGPFEVKKEALRATREVPRYQRKFAVVVAPPHQERRPSRGNPSSFGSGPESGGDSDDDLEMSFPTLEPPERQYDCKHYETCLDLAASLNWVSFSCKGCVGEVNRALYWRAHQVQRKDSVARALCELRPLESVEGNRRAVGARDGESNPGEPSSQLRDSHTIQKPTDHGRAEGKAFVVPIPSKRLSGAVTIETDSQTTAPRIAIVIAGPGTNTSSDLITDAEEQEDDEA